MTTNDFIGLGIPFVGILLVWYFIELSILFSVLKRRDAELWNKLGNPSVFKNSSFGNAVKFVRSLSTDDYASSPARDDLRARVLRIKVLLYAIVTLFLLGAFALIASA